MATLLSTSPHVLAVCSSASAPWLDALQAYCTRAAVPCECVATLAALPGALTAQPTVLVLAGAWADPVCHTAIGLARVVAPEAALLLCCDDAPDALALDDAGLFGACPGGDAETLARWVHAATVAVQGQSRLRERQAQSVSSLAHALRSVDPFASVLYSVLTTAVAVLTQDGAADGLTGALLLVDDIGNLTLGAGLPPFQDELPPEALAVAERAAERLTVARADTFTALPLQWRDHPHGVLLFAGTALPDPLPDLARLLVDFTAAALENAVLFELAAVDSTTRTFTRTYAIKRLYEALKGAFRSGQEISVLMLDLDRFKQINDTFGHLTGDRVLRDVGGLLHHALRETDILGRYGGDEFLIVLPNTDSVGSRAVAGRIAASVEAYRLAVDNVEVSVDISIGIGGIAHQGDAPDAAALRPAHDFFQHALERVIAQADGLMYMAKHGETYPHISAATPLSWGQLMRTRG